MLNSLVLILNILLVGYFAIGKFKDRFQYIELLIVALPLLNLFKRVSNIFPSLESIVIIIIAFRILFLGSSISYKVYKVSIYDKILLSVFIIASFISSFFSNDVEMSMKVFVSGVLIVILFYYLLHYVDFDHAKLLRLSDAMFVLLIQIFIFTILAYIRRYQLGYISAYNADELSHLYSEENSAGFFSVPSVTGAILAMIAPFGFFFIREKQLIKGVLMIVIGLVSALLTLKRGAWLSIGLSVFVGLYAYQRFTRIINLKYVVLIGALVFIVFHYLDVSVLFESRTNYVGGFMRGSDVRISTYRIAIQSWFIYPVIGTGFGSFREVYTHFFNNSHINLVFAHNLFLTLIVEIGAIGAISFTLFFVKNIFTARRFGEFYRFSNVIIVGSILGFLVSANITGMHLVNTIADDAQNLYFSSPAIILVFLLLFINKKIGCHYES